VSELMTPDQLEAALRRIGAERYHSHHPFHKLLHGGRLSKGQVQAWALNRYYYQARIPMKDATILARMEDPALRRAWRQRIIDHDGEQAAEGGIERWLKLTSGLDLPRAYVTSTAGILPATRFAVDAYVHFVRERSLLEAIASSLTELFAPTIIADRVQGMLANYDFITSQTLAYFDRRLTQAPRDAEFALEFVKREATRPDQQQAVLDALIFKCDVLWAQLDALHVAYVEPALVPPGAFRAGGAMSARAEVCDDSTPALARGVRLRFDQARSAWVLLAPERVLMPDEIAVEILKRCDGEATVRAIVADLARTFEAEAVQVAADVRSFLQDLADKGMVTL
jgi:pyrroloquinoline quinone biosynthesis protein D